MIRLQIWCGTGLTRPRRGSSCWWQSAAAQWWGTRCATAPTRRGRAAPSTWRTCTCGPRRVAAAWGSASCRSSAGYVAVCCDLCVAVLDVWTERVVAAQMAVREGVSRVDWHVLESNAPALGFYRRLGARDLRVSEGRAAMRLDAPHIQQLALSDL